MQAQLLSYCSCTFRDLINQQLISHCMLCTGWDSELRVQLAWELASTPSFSTWAHISPRWYSPPMNAVRCLSTCRAGGNSIISLNATQFLPKDLKPKLHFSRCTKKSYWRHSFGALERLSESYHPTLWHELHRLQVNDQKSLNRYWTRLVRWSKVWRSQVASIG